MLVGPGRYSEVYMFSHRDADASNLFIAITTTHARIMLTPDHYLYVNNHLAVAGAVKVGDMLRHHDGASVEVTHVEVQRADGA